MNNTQRHHTYILRSAMILAIFLLLVSNQTATTLGEQQEDAKVKAVDTFDWNYLAQLTMNQRARPERPSNDLFTVEQPNGLILHVRKRGAESYNWLETVSGWVIKLNRDNGWYEYLMLGGNGEYKLSGLRAGIDDPRSYEIRKYLRESKEVIGRKVKNYLALTENKTTLPPRKTPASGVVKQLVILVTFPSYTTGAGDTEIEWTFEPIFTRDEFDRLFNQRSYGDYDGHGSFRDYWLEASYDELDVESTVTEWIELPERNRYYAHGPTGSGGPLYQEFVNDAITTLNDSGFDFSEFDGDGDGYLDALCILHQNKGGENTGGTHDNLWSKKDTLDTPRTVDGVTITAWYTIPELKDYGEMSSIGIACHEFGHMLGLEDLYDVGEAEGVGNWCLMSNGNKLDRGKRPAHPLAYHKIQLGWVTPVDITTFSTRLELSDCSARQPGAFTISRRMGSEEYFILENRQQVGFDSALPGHGLIISHVDESQVQNIDPNHYKVGILQADGFRQLEGLGGHGINRGDDGDPFPGLFEKVTIGPSTDPSSDNYAGGNTGIWIANIAEGGRRIVFDIGLGLEPAYPYWPGPDDYGYSGYKASGGFEDISDDGTEIEFSDESDGTAIIDYPDNFKFYFYSEKKDPSDRRMSLVRDRNVMVSTNGWITFSRFETDSYPVNKRIPSSLAPKYLVAPLWKDLRVDEPGLWVKYKLIGTSPERVFIIQWRAERQSESMLTTRVDFQVKLHETGDIEFCYDTIMMHGDISATIGIQKHGTTGLRYSFLGERRVSGGDRIVITRNARPMGIMATTLSNRGRGTEFSATFMDPDGFRDLDECYILLSRTAKTGKGVYLVYKCSTDKIGLRNNDNSNWMVGTPGGQSLLSNNRANLPVSEVRVKRSKKSIKISFPLSFKGSFVGLKNIYLKAKDKGGLESSWVSDWSYRILNNSTPKVLSLKPSGGQGYSATYAATYTDPDGSSDMKTLSFVIHDNIDMFNSVYLEYDVKTNMLKLRAADNSRWIEGKVGTAGILGNGNANINLLKVWVDRNKTDIELGLPIIFSQIYTGMKNIYMKVEDTSGAASPWRMMGMHSVN